MAHALRRILRFRQLAEEQARLEVERAAQVLRQASTACERQIAAERRQRSTLAESWRPEAAARLEARTTEGENAWFLEEAALNFSGWKRRRLEQILEAESRRIEPMIERYKERRRELRQAEQLLAQQAAIEKMEKDRRAQAAADEWFLERSLVNRRRARQRERVLRQPRMTEEEEPSSKV